MWVNIFHKRLGLRWRVGPLSWCNFYSLYSLSSFSGAMDSILLIPEVSGMLLKGGGRSLFLAVNLIPLSTYEMSYLQTFYQQAYLKRRNFFQEKRSGPASNFPHECSKSAKRIPTPKGCHKWEREEFHINFVRQKSKDGLCLQCDHNFHFK